MVGVTVRREQRQDTKGLDLAGKRFGPGLCGPPWASRNGTTNGFTGKDPLSDMLSKVAKGISEEPRPNGNPPRVMTDFMADFVANTFAAVNNQGKQTVAQTQ